MKLNIAIYTLALPFLLASCDGNNANNVSDASSKSDGYSELASKAKNMATDAVKDEINKQVADIPVVADMAQSKLANTLTPTGVRVIDGDTIEVLLPNSPSERIRFLGIDAPESKQPMGNASTASLQKCIDQGNVTVVWNKKDRYDRIIGKVMANGMDCNLYQVANGMAWHYKQYQNEQTSQDRSNYALAEQQAQQANLGVWGQDCNIAPWDWRKGQKFC